MTEILVKKIQTDPEVVCEVIIKEGASSTKHQVHVPGNLYHKLTKGNASEEECVRASFAFLLDRENKESILSRFDLPVISQYFPEFEKEFKNYL